MPVRKPGLADKQWEKIEEEWITRYHNLFATPQGEMVRGDMLEELHFYQFEPIKTTEEMARLNYAKRLLYLCGGFKTTIIRKSKKGAK